MIAAKEECREEWEEGYERECFELVFPLEFLMPDGSFIALDSEEEYMNIRNWYLENPESEEEAVLQYPVNIVYETDSGDSSVVINDEEAMIAAKEACYDEWEEGDDEWGEDEWGEDEGDQCYNFVYPISFTMPDGTTLPLKMKRVLESLNFGMNQIQASKKNPHSYFLLKL